jgi:protoporphyrinogen oxidase
MLVNRGHAVTLLEQSPRLGGVLHSSESNGLYLDLGCHLFTNTDPESTRFIFEILDGEYHSVSVEYASITRGELVDEISIPDFTGLSKEQKATILYEQASQRSAENQQEHTDLDARLRHRYGATVAEMLAPVVEKIGLAHPAELDPSTLQRTPLSRVRIYDDETAELLKQIPEFNEILAVPSQEDPMRFYPQAREYYPHKNFYPSNQGMRGFVTAATEYLEAKGVKILTECKITDLRSSQESVQVDLADSCCQEARQLIWTAGPENLAPMMDSESWDYAHNVPMVLYYFFVPEDSNVNYTYLHDFSPDSHVYRLSAPGFYGNQRNERGQSYICAEVPTTTDSDIWEQPGEYVDTIWKTAVEYDLIQGTDMRGVEIKQTPVSYPLYEAGARAAFDDLIQQINTELPAVDLLGLDKFSKVDIVHRLRELLDNEYTEQ